MVKIPYVGDFREKRRRELQRKERESEWEWVIFLFRAKPPFSFPLMPYCSRVWPTVLERNKGAEASSAMLGECSTWLPELEHSLCLETLLDFMGSMFEHGLLCSSIPLPGFKVPNEFFWVLLLLMPPKPGPNTLIYISWYLRNFSCDS